MVTATRTLFQADKRATLGKMEARGGYVVERIKHFRSWLDRPETPTVVAGECGDGSVRMAVSPPDAAGRPP
jgi:hypothetical protein